jgi:hypothetical protein
MANGDWLIPALEESIPLWAVRFTSACQWRTENCATLLFAHFSITVVYLMFNLMYNQNHCGKTFPFKSNKTKRNIEVKTPAF